MSIDTRYNPEEIEDKWYKHWEENGYFHSEPDERESYSIVIPPPNVTGVLHMGHMLNNTIQDVLIRKARMDGKNACWVPGTDHASIATEAKVVKMLREKGIKKSDLTRDEFLKHAFAWKDEYGGIILNQLKKLGASCDWERTAFTMDEDRSKAVIQCFVDLYNRDKLYRQLRMVNWDPEAQTVLSNEEVLHKEEHGKLYHVRYQVEGEDTYITIATTRPETIIGDSAVAVHPEDERYVGMKGKSVIVPLVNRVVPIIFDDYVDREFGTGALKVTPAHDVNDYEIGKRHKLEVINVFNDNGTISDAGQLYIGLDRFKVRKEITKALEESGNLVEIEDYHHSVGRSERTNAVVEPKLSLQWYVNMQSIVKPALENVENDEVEFFPKNQKNTYRHWMTNIRDWCISRQLWWGHRIPVWYYREEMFVATTEAKALAQAKEKYPDIKLEDLRQDEDVLDTWFSSWLWPISVFNGFENREELDYYYPTSVLVTGWDIIFLWVARMVMAGYEWENKRPFDHVYFTGMVRDKKRRKMSKSLGNSPDALGLIKEFGADGVRFGMLSCSPAGGDLLFDDKLCDQGRKFSNKLWNALRLIQGWETDDSIAVSSEDQLAIDWIEQRMSVVLAETAGNFKEYRLSEALITTYSFIWGDFCSWFLEMVKPPYQEKISTVVKNKSIAIYTEICKMLHPFMPFITEEIRHQLADIKAGDDCMMSMYPQGGKVSEQFTKDIEQLKSIVSGVREIRSSKGLKKAAPLEFVSFETEENKRLLSLNGFESMLRKIGVLGSVESVSAEPENCISFVSGTEKYGIILEEAIDVEAELAKLEKDLKYEQGFVKSIQGKLSNEGFVKGAPEAVVANERKKLADGQERIKAIEASIKGLKG